NAVTKFLAVLMLVNGVAPILAPVLGGIILEFSTWKTVFLVLTAFGAIMFCLSFYKLTESLPENNRSSGRISEILGDFKELLKNTKFSLPFIVQSVYGVSSFAFSWMFAFNGLGLIFSGQLVNKLVDRFDEHTLMKVFAFVQIIGVIIVSLTLLNSWSIWILMIGFFILVS